MDRVHERLLGTILVVLSLALLLFTFYHTYSLLTQLTGTKSATDPQAQFDYSVAGYTVTVTDLSKAGSSPITQTFWSFADGNTSGRANTTHTYAKAGAFNVTLIVENANGAASESAAAVHVGPGANGAGTGSPSFSPGGSVGSILGSSIGGALGGVVSTAETFALLTVMWLVGASILKAGWNLITPKAETIQVRVKPKSLEVEGAGYSAMPQFAASPTSAGPMATAAPSAPAPSRAASP